MWQSRASPTSPVSVKPEKRRRMNFAWTMAPRLCGRITRPHKPHAASAKGAEIVERIPIARPGRRRCAQRPPAASGRADHPPYIRPPGRASMALPRAGEGDRLRKLPGAGQAHAHGQGHDLAGPGGPGATGADFSDPDAHPGVLGLLRGFQAGHQPIPAAPAFSPVHRVRRAETPSERDKNRGSRGKRDSGGAGGLGPGACGDGAKNAREGMQGAACRLNGIGLRLQAAIIPAEPWPNRTHQAR
jgi:hypothetical protein